MGTPDRRFCTPVHSGGAAFSRGKLYAMLAKPLYFGRIRRKGTVYPGQHAAILDSDVWQAVQQRFAEHRRRTSGPREPMNPSPLAEGGLTRCAVEPLQQVSDRRHVPAPVTAGSNLAAIQFVGDFVFGSGRTAN